MSENYTVAELELGVKMVNEGCKQCANCCNQQVITFTREDWDKIAQLMDINPSKLALETRTVPLPVDNPTMYKLVAYPCPFLDGANRCKVYHLRPQCCRDHPFGKALMEAKIGKTAKINVKCPIVREWAMKVALKRRLKT